MRPEPFVRRVCLIAAVGLVCRLAYALVVLHGVGVAGDGLEFHTLARQLAAGDGYVEPLFLAPGHLPTADKPPLYPLVLAAPALLGASSVVWNRIVSCLLGTVLVVALGLLGRRVGGERAGLAAAALGAVYPVFVALDGSVRSESLYAPLVAFALLAAYRLRDRPSVRRAAVLGAVVGLAALTRSEAVLLLVLAPVAAPAGRGRALIAAVLACVLVLSPWLIRNWATFGEPALSTNVGALVSGSNCPAAYYSDLIGTWACFPQLHATRRLNEVQLASRLDRIGLRYARRHSARLPAVMAVRLLRTWGFWSPRRSAALEALIDDSDVHVEQAGIVVYYLVLVLALGGVLMLRRRDEPLAILLIPLALVALTSVLAYGTSRFRVAADVALVILAGVTLARLAERRLTPVRSRGA
jgi:4-amino-4-deoxy-L-arabinose transferase-like glycosyltransferase